MAKKSGRKTKGSAKADNSSSANPDGNASKAPILKNANMIKSGSKKVEIACQFCHKPMKDDKTRKLHERNCKAKHIANPPQKDRFETAILELKDHFNDEVMSMSKTLAEREEHHQRELDEVKTVLRMEIDRHRKELERIDKSEKDATASGQTVANGQAASEQVTANPQPIADVQPQHTEPSHPATSSEPGRVRDSRPRAIDLIPMHMPTIPKKKFYPLPEEDSIPEIDGDEFSAKASSVSGIGRVEIETLVREIVKESIPVMPVIDNTERFAAKADQFSGRMDFIESKLDRNITEIKKNIEKISKDTEYKRIEREMEKVSEKVLDIMEDSGYGESLSVAKIPPTILEIVYQAILDDIHIEIVKTKGPQDAERVARSALEEVRLKTSGSELFKFDGRKIVTDSLAKSIEANMISARQIQTTYDVLLDKLLETVPHHKAKNFKGMIKVKSQEFAVDRATKLTKEFGKFEKIVESTNQMVAAMAANFSTRNLELHEMLNEMKDNTLATKADRDEIDVLKSKVEDIVERNIRLADEFALLKAELDMKEKIKSHEDGSTTEGSEFLLAPGEMPFPESPNASEDFQTTPEPSADETLHLKMILDAVERGIGSKTALMKDTGLEEIVVIQALNGLVEQKKIIEKKIGKRLKYATLEREFEDKLNAGMVKQVEKINVKKSTKKKPDEKPEKEPVPTEPTSEEQLSSAIEPEPEKKSVPDYDFKRLEPSKSKKGKKAQEQVEPPEQSVEDKIVSTGHHRKKKEKVPSSKKKDKVDAPSKNTKAEKEETVPDVAKVERPGKAKEHLILESKLEKDSSPILKELEEEMPSPRTKKELEKESLDVKNHDALPEETIRVDDLPVIRKSLAELSEDEVHVLEAISEEGMTVSGIQSKVGKHIRRFALLRALRVLIDSGHVGILTKGRLELYQKINVQKMDKMKQENKQKEVK